MGDPSAVRSRALTVSGLSVAIITPVESASHAASSRRHDPLRPPPCRARRRAPLHRGRRTLGAAPREAACRCRRRRGSRREEGGGRLDLGPERRRSIPALQVVHWRRHKGCRHRHGRQSDDAPPQRQGDRQGGLLGKPGGGRCHKRPQGRRQRTGRHRRKRRGPGWVLLPDRPHRRRRQRAGDRHRWHLEGGPRRQADRGGRRPRRRQGGGRPVEECSRRRGPERHGTAV